MALKLAVSQKYLAHNKNDWKLDWLLHGGIDKKLGEEFTKS